MRILYIDCFLGFDAGMLLGALIDAGANPDFIAEDLKSKEINISITVQSAERSSIICKKATVSAEDDSSYIRAQRDDFVCRVMNQYDASQSTDALYICCALAAAQQLGIEYIITSEVSLGEGTDGRVLDILTNAGIDIMPSDSAGSKMEPADASLLSAFANECGPKPSMDIISIGYGAGGSNPDEPNIVNAYIGETDGDSLFEAEDMELLMASL